MLWPLRHAHPGTCLGWEYCAKPPTLGRGTKQESVKYTLKSRYQNLISMHVEEAFTTWHFWIILLSLGEVALNTDFLVHAEILPLWKAFFNFTTPYTEQERHSSYFFISNWPGLVLKLQHFYELLGHITFRMFSSQCHNSLVVLMKITSALRSSG